MKESIPLLISIAAIVLLVGILGIATIVLISKKSHRRPDISNSRDKEHEKNVDPWLEAGKRLHEEYNEQDI
jgi:hypothetical protein